MNWFHKLNIEYRSVTSSNFCFSISAFHDHISALQFEIFYHKPLFQRQISVWCLISVYKSHISKIEAISKCMQSYPICVWSQSNSANASSCDGASKVSHKNCTVYRCCFLFVYKTYLFIGTSIKMVQHQTAHEKEEEKNIHFKLLLQ